MSFTQDFQHRAILPSSVKGVPKINMIPRSPTFTKIIPGHTVTDNTGKNDLSLFTSQPPRGVAPDTVTTGFNVFTPTANVFYVSSSTGNNSNNGTSPLTPVKTIAAGKALMTNGQADQLLLKCGDVWTGENFGIWTALGPSSTNPAIIGTYGTGDRPQLRLPTGVVGFTGTSTGVGITNLAIQGIDFYAYTRDPNNPNYVGASTAAADHGSQAIVMDFPSGANGNWVLIEDCKASFFNYGILLQSFDNGSLPQFMANSTLILNRNIINTSYDGGFNSAGMYLQGFAVIKKTQNVINYGGWIDDAGLIAQNCGPNLFSRDLYLQGNVTGTGPTVLTADGNMYFNSSGTGSQFRAAQNGTITNNLFAANMGDGFSFGETNGTSGFNTDSITSVNVSQNVVINSLDIRSTPVFPGGQPAGGGIQITKGNGSGVKVFNNIIAHSSSSNTINANAVHFTTDCVNVTGVQRNIIFKYPHSVLEEGSGDTLDATNAIDLAGANTAGYSHPAPTATGSTSLVGDYYNSIGGTVNLSDFIAACISRPRGTWIPKLSAYAVNDYIQSGFNTNYRS